MKYRAIVKDNYFNTIKNVDAEKLEDLLYLYDDPSKYEIIKIFKYEEV